VNTFSCSVCGYKFEIPGHRDPTTVICAYCPVSDNNPAVPSEDTVTHNRLQVFLYLLMRDSVNTGAVEHAMDGVRTLGNQMPRFTSQHLADYADCLAEELLLGVPCGNCDVPRYGNGEEIHGDKAPDRQPALKKVRL
jgi:hypothetical protein